MKIANEIIYFVFPLLFAGLIHHLVIIKYNLFSFIYKPIDYNLHFRDKPLFGKSKTWRGLLAVPVLSSLGSLIVSQAVSVSINLHSIVVGFLLGLGYAIAELPNSFIKRRFSIPAGKKARNKLGIFFLIFDQIDSVLGAILVMLLIYPASFFLCVLLLVIGGTLHFLVDLYLYKYGYKKSSND